MAQEIPYSTIKGSGFKLSWQLIARLGIALVTIAALSFSAATTSHFHSRLLVTLTLFGFIVAATLVSLWKLKIAPPSKVFVYAQLFLDVALITVVVYATGAAISPFLFLYLPIVMTGAVLLSRKAALALSLIVASLYSALIWSLRLRLIPAFDGGSQIELPSNGFFLQVVGLSSGMILISIATDFLMKAISSRDKLVEQSARHVLELSERQRTLLHEIPEAIVTTDRKDQIVSVNSAAQGLLGISDREAHGRSIAELFASLQGDEKNSSFELLEQGEISISSGNGTPVTQLRYSRSNFQGTGTDAQGYMYVFQDITRLRSVEEQLELQDRMARLLAATQQEPHPSPKRLADFVGESGIMQKVFALIERVAASDATVLINGESGTGKELVARAIHKGSTRVSGSFVAVNCGAIPENLVESELFGHKKGSFTGAHVDRTGLFQQAQGGTIFLDEIGELPLSMQAKLLRTIQEKTIRPVGGDKDIPINVRILTATNRNLKTEIERGNFREDLFYRINVITVNLPPLRDRKEDIPLLVDAILKRLVQGSSERFGEKMIGTQAPVVPPETMQILTQYNYPGNVRELENLIERAFVLGGAVVLPDHLPDSVRQTALASGEALAARGTVRETQIIIDERIDFPVDLDSILNTLERRYLEVALLKTGGAKKRAAELLGMNFRSFRYRLQKYGIAGED